MPAGVTYTSSKLEAQCKQRHSQNRVKRGYSRVTVNEEMYIT